MTARAWVLDPPCDWLIASVDAGLFLVCRDELAVDRAPQLARRVVRDVQQLDAACRRRLTGRLTPARGEGSDHRKDRQPDADLAHRNTLS